MAWQVNKEIPPHFLFYFLDNIFPESLDRWTAKSLLLFKYEKVVQRSDSGKEKGESTVFSLIGKYAGSYAHIRWKTLIF